MQPDKIAARDLARSMSYRQWNARANRLANALLGLGLAKRDRVAVVISPHARSSDGKTGLAWVPDLQPLEAWDGAERLWRHDEALN